MPVKRWLLLGLLAIPGMMLGQAYVNSGNQGTGAASCVVTLSVTAGNTALVLVGSTTNPVTFTGMTDTNGDTFTTIGGPEDVNGMPTQLYLATLGTTNATETFTSTVSSSAQYTQCMVVQYSGLAANPVDEVTLYTLGSVFGSFTSNTFPANFTNELVFAAMGVVGQFVGTTASPFTVRSDAELSGSVTLAGLDANTATGGPQQFTFTLNSSSSTSGGQVYEVTLKTPSSAPVSTSGPTATMILH